ncbi:MAG: redoxin family protein [Armatimonadaceae bacterium]
MKLAWTLGLTGLLMAGITFTAGARPEAPSRKAAAGLLSRIPTVKDIKNRQTSLSQLAGPKGLVIAYTSTSCPVTKRQLANIAQLEDQFRTKGINFVYVNPIETDSIADANRVAASTGLNGSYVIDTDKAISRILAPRTTAEVFVFNAKQELVYRGAADDQYSVTGSLPKPRNQWLLSTLGAVVAGKKPATANVEPSGCALEPVAEAPATAVTYYETVAPIIQKNCVSCHRTGGIAPFKLDTIADVKAHAGMIKQTIEQGTMPPWQAAPAVGTTTSPWVNDCSLPAADKNTILTWLSGPRALGNIAKAPKPLPAIKDGWTLGQPDMIVTMPQALFVPATGVIPYKIMDAEVKITEDKWVQSVEVVPGAKQVVHHVLIFIRKPGVFTVEDLNERASFFAAYVPGTSTAAWPEGLAKKLPKGTVLRFQMHYTTNGTAVSDQTKLGIRFATKAPEHEIKVTGVSNTRFRIPPGDPNYKVVSSLPIPMDIKMTALMPHMHVRGKAAKYELVFPDGTRKLLLDVPRYDFNWQHTYRYAEPLMVPKNSRLEYTCWFDNSPANKNNPDPKREVPWGPQTFDEMQLGYIEYYALGKDDTTELVDEDQALDSMFENMFGQIDKNSDGVVTRDEFQNPAFAFLDKDKDGKLTKDEAKVILQFIGRSGFGGGQGGFGGRGVGRGRGAFPLGGGAPQKP